PLLTPVELALLRNDRPAALAFQKAKMSHIDAVKRDVRGRRKEKPPVSRPAAYDALIQQGLRLLAPDELIRWNRTLLESAFPNEIGATHPLSVVPLFLTPETQEGRLVRLEGVCRRALKIQVTDQEIVSRLGLKEYFEMWLFTEDSQEFPIVCIVHRLPRGIPEGDDICEMVRVRGVFLKTWTFESSRTLQRKAQLAQLSLQKGERKQAGELVGGQPPSPVVIGLDAEWMRSAAVANPIGELIRAAVLGFLVLFVVGVWTAINWNRKSDTLLEARLQRARTPDGMTLNLSDVPVLAEPDFRNYGREESTAASSGDQNGAREPHDSSSASASAQEPAGARPGE
ncbi:MAG TPA: hypothetical protein VGE52_19755, partial [Pirellulales bacterium]